MPFLIVRSNSYKLLKIIFLVFTFLMKSVISGLSAVTGLTAGTGNSCNDTETKNKRRGRPTLHQRLPLLQHITAQSFCVLPSSPVEWDSSLLKSWEICRWLNPNCPHAHTKSACSFWGLTLDKRPCSFKGKQGKIQGRKHKSTESLHSCNFPQALLLQTCGSNALRILFPITLQSQCSPHWTLGNTTEIICTSFNEKYKPT